MSDPPSKQRGAGRHHRRGTRPRVEHGVPAPASQLPGELAAVAAVGVQRLDTIDVGTGPPAIESGHLVATVLGRGHQGTPDEVGAAKDEQSHQQPSAGETRDRRGAVQEALGRRRTAIPTHYGPTPGMKR